MLFLILLVLVLIFATSLGTFLLVALNLLYRAAEAIFQGVCGGVVLFCRLLALLIYSNVFCARWLWARFEALQIATAQRLYAWWFGYYWRWQRRYIARELRARRRTRHA